MRHRLDRVLIASVFLAMVALRPSVGAAAPCAPCEGLLTADFGPEVTIISAELRTEISGIGMTGPFTIPVPEYCDVRGVIAPAQGFDVKLPTWTYNGRLYVVGNSVAAGSIEEGSMVPGIFQGFATAGTDTGHQGEVVDWSFAYNPPDNSNPDAEEKLIDYCDESIHETTVLAKTLADTYYCAAPEYSYYVGCSTGGRQGLIEAQRYPADFDGILVGAPVHYFSEIMMRGVWEGQQLLGPGTIDLAKLPLLAAAVAARCDSTDGLVDGVIDDPHLCPFDAQTDLPACAGDVDGTDCFTTAQRSAIYAVYDGPRNSAGELLTFGEPLGSEALADGASGWIPWLVWPVELGGPGLGLSPLVGAGAVGFFGLEPPPGMFWDFMTFNFDTDWPQVAQKVGPLCDANDPDLSEFRDLGGKMVHYDGWADNATGPYQSAAYYDDVLDLMGDDQTQDFYKLYMIPGMFHCGGGVGCFDIEALFGALVGWVEDGIEPTAYTGARPDGRTRPMCPYPQVARYLGAGSIDDTASFVCAEPTASWVYVAPSTLRLSKTKKFTAVVMGPSGLNLRHWENVAVVCEGALAQKVVKVPGLPIYLAQFDTDDLINITAGEAVTFAVTAVLEKGDRRIALEGRDTVRVVE
ncbi:MAG: tannase/feruloyl esterase family alpha/beta hydrolase [Polyangiaceae bacterium]|nr:tannase/feruloyl esterase family alpha/beta hydrolase [Polyangiaceae bacterium]